LIAVKENQTARERKIRELVSKFCSGLRFHSRVGRGALGAQLPRLRFDAPTRFYWLKYLVASANDLDNAGLALTITGPDSSALDLRRDWAGIEVHAYDARFMKQAEEICQEYVGLTGRSAAVVADFREKKSLWRPVYSLTLALALISLAVLAARIFSITTLKNFLNF
jgi:hypothetical protein